MNIKKMKWLSTIFTTLFIGIFEFARHHFLSSISMSWGNLLVAILAGALFYCYFHGVFSLLERIYKRLRTEQEERAVLQERDRIARELHDNISQALFFMNIKVLEIEKALGKQEPLAAVTELKEAICLTDADIRQKIFALQKTSADNINLKTFIQEYLTHYEAENHVQVNLEITGDSDSKLSNQTKKRIIGIFQELLVNIRKHAEAKKVQVCIREDEQGFSMVIEDDGKGFDVGTVKRKKTSFGYKNVTEDARDMGASFVVQSILNEGTRVTLSFDL